jgi:hypothetical protein
VKGERNHRLELHEIFWSKVQNMGPIFHPSLDEQSRFATPLTDGERQLRDFFLEKLDESWHVFVQPHMLNQQPDFLLVSLEHGAEC